MDQSVVPMINSIITLFAVGITSILYTKNASKIATTEVKVAEAKSEIKSVEAKADTDTVLLLAKIKTIEDQSVNKDVAFAALHAEKDLAVKALQDRVTVLEGEKVILFATNVQEKALLETRIRDLEVKIEELRASNASENEKLTTKILALEAENLALREDLKAAQQTISKLAESISKGSG